MCRKERCGFECGPAPKPRFSGCGTDVAEMWPCTVTAVLFVDVRKNNNYFFFLYFKIPSKSQFRCRATFLPHPCHIHEIAAWVQGHILGHISFFATETTLQEGIRTHWDPIFDGFFHRFWRICSKSTIRDERGSCVIQYSSISDQFLRYVQNKEIAKFWTIS